MIHNYDKYVVCAIASGFTDQIWNLRAAISIQKLYNKNVKLDISWFNEYGKDYLGIENRNLEVLNIFKDINLPLASKDETENAKKDLFIHGEKHSNIDKFLKQNRKIYVDGYCAHFDKIPNLLDFNEIFDLDKYLYPLLNERQLKIYKDIVNCEAVALHIRRGDYMYACIKSGINIRVNIDYINKCLKYFNDKFDNVKFYIFSNNFNYVKNNIVPILEGRYKYDLIENNKEYIDFYLMSKCKHQISTLGKFAKTAFIFNKYSNKIFVSVDNIDNLKKEYFKENIANKFYPFVYEEYSANIKSSFKKDSMAYVMYLIEEIKAKNILQIGLLDGIETHSLLSYGISCDRDFKLLCFDNNERDIIGIELQNLSDKEKEIFNLHNEELIFNVNDILKCNDKIDFVIITKESSHPLVIIYLIYLFPYLTENSIIILTDLQYSYNYYIFDNYMHDKEVFFNYEYNEYDNVGYLKVNKIKLLKLIENIIQMPFDINNNLFFYNRIIDIRNDYYNYFDMDAVSERLIKLKQYMYSNFDICFSDRILNILENNIRNCFITINDRFNKMKNEVDLLNNLSNYNEYKINQLYNIIDNIINQIAWWIPIKKLRDNFKNKFKMREEKRREEKRREEKRRESLIFEYAYNKKAA